MRAITHSLLFIFLMLQFSCNPATKEIPGTFQAGFKTIRSSDPSRFYKPNTDTSDYLHYRPIDLDVWYPAQTAPSDTALLFGNILGLLEKRANYYTASKSAAGFTQQLADYLCKGFKCSDPARLLSYRTASYQDAKPAGGKFPLIIYLCSYNGMGYENFSLFEDLAKKGFWVISINSIGRYPGDMTMRNGDLMEQVNDALFSYKIIAASPEVDVSKVGIVGYSWGGLTAAVLAEKIPGTACLVSLDGSEFHHYGQVHEEDLDFNGIVNNPEFKDHSLSMPYLRLESSSAETNQKEDSLYNFAEKLSGKKLILSVDSAAHEDFGCLSAVVNISGGCMNNHKYEGIAALTENYLEDHLKGTNTFPPLLKQQLNKTIKEK